ncbi:hypothetical protein A2483_02340, partial [Candidatus Peregrinibacteria bacterium RIFOXYC2_FULL_33_13]
EKLEQFNISLAQITQAIQANNAKIPLGNIEQENKKYTIRFDGSINNAEEIKNIPITVKNNTPVLLQDIALISDSLEEPKNYSRISINGKKSQDSISLEIYKKSGGNVIRIAENLKKEIQNINKETKNKYNVYIVTDNAKYIKEQLGTLSTNGIQTIIIVIILLLLFLGWRESIIAGLSVPLTFLMSFAGLLMLGYTLNFLTLFSLILALGILVDSAIVVTESIHKNILSGMSSLHAAKKTLKDYQWPIISGTLTTVAAFIPMMFASGIMGQFIRNIPVTVTIVLASSLFVSLGLNPMIASHFLSRKKDKETKLQKYIDKTSVWYETKVCSFLESRKKQKLLTIILALSFVFSIFLPASGLLKVIMFPQIDIDYFWLNLEMPSGTTLKETNKVAQEVEQILYTKKPIESYVTAVGVAGGSAGGGSQNSHLASFTINLRENREQTSTEIIEELRSDVQKIKKGKITLSQESSGPPQGSPVNITFIGEDLNELERLAKSGQKLLSQISGATNIQTSIKEAPVEFSLKIDRQQAAQVGLTPIQIAGALRSSINGLDASKLKINSDEINIFVRLNLNPQSANPYEADETNINVIQNLSIQTPQGSVPLSAITKTELKSGVTSISHEDGKKISKVTADVAKGSTVTQIVKEFQKNTAKLNLPENYTINYGGEAEDIQESFGDMFKALFIGIFLIAAILILEFNSYRQPLFILMTIPLALIAIFPGLALIGLPLSFPAFIGIVALAGIVVNNAIILIDQINSNRLKGQEMIEAIKNAALSRLQPILLTTITTVAGIFPLAISDVTWGPLGFSMIFGLLFSTVLTLFVVPMLYKRFAEKKL